jgi:transposase
MTHHGPYSPQLKKFLLDQLRDENGKIVVKWGDVDRLSKLPGAASKRTIWNWIKAEEVSTDIAQAKKKRGPECKLSVEEKHILAGKVLSRLSHHKTVDLIFIRLWIEESFGVKVCDSTASDYMHELGFSSKIAHSSIIQSKEADMKEMIKWLEDTRTFIKEQKLNDSNIVCMDQISFWDHGIPLRSYAVVGG